MTNTNPISLMCVSDVRFVKIDCVIMFDLVAVMAPLFDEGMLCRPLAKRTLVVLLCSCLRCRIQPLAMSEERKWTVIVFT